MTMELHSLVSVIVIGRGLIVEDCGLKKELRASNEGWFLLSERSTCMREAMMA